MDSKYSAFDNKPNRFSKFKIKCKPLGSFPNPIKVGNNNNNNVHNKHSSSPHKKMKITTMNNNQESSSSYYNNFTKNSNNHLPINSKSKISIQEQRSKLPIFHNKREVLEYIKKYDTLVLLGETGSGKTTQIPQYIQQAKIHGKGKIGVTQPRRVAAISVATRVAQEYGNGQSVGELVGYTVRFHDVTSDKTQIKYLTDGMLLRESMFDKLLLVYSVIILDEAHERTIHTDVLFGIVKNAQKLRKLQSLQPLKVIVMSATMDVDHFAKYFDDCPVIYIEGRTYPVHLFYTLEPHEEDYQTACVSIFFKIHREAPPNDDVLIFLTGQEEIESVAHQIRTLARDPEVEGPSVRVHSLYAGQPSTQQMSVFQPTLENTRKVIVSTNVAETSVTITGVKYIIDCGMVKARTYHPETGLELLKVQQISQEQACQRTGRTGRESEGNCYRLYTRAQYEAMKKSSTPEIQRANLVSVTLQLLTININPADFDFMDRPQDGAITAAFEQLRLLKAVKDSRITEIGRSLSKFPLDPRFGKILLCAPEFGCLEEVLTVVALLSVDSVILSPPSKRDDAQKVQRKFHSGYGDHITLLNIYREFNNVGQNTVRSWCQEHYINMRNILQARDVRSQLADICSDCDIRNSSCGSNMDQVRKCLLTGLFMNVAELHKDRQYVTLDKKQVVWIHPSSVLHGQQPPYVVFTDVVQTTKCYLRSISTIDNEWLEEIVPDYAQRCKAALNYREVKKSK